MKIKPLYRFVRENGGVTVSPNKPECEYAERMRLIADEGKKLTLDGETLCGCVDVDTADGWYEVDAPSKERRKKE